MVVKELMSAMEAGQGLAMYDVEYQVSSAVLE